MGFKVSVGESDFASLREKGAYYVDKTDILYELVEKTNNKVTLFTRPRRFGKTLMMNMMENFFSIRKSSGELFEGLAVSQHKEFCEKWMNKCPVLFISFKDIEGLDFEGAYAMLKYRIAEVCMSVAEVSAQTELDRNLSETFKKLRSKEATVDDVKGSLKSVMNILYKTYGKKVILLIDEYDVPLAKASRSDLDNGGYYKEMLDVIRAVMSTAIKDNEFLEFALITGCLKIAKESIFTGTNNFASYSVIDKRFSEFYGFTQTEVDDMLETADLKEAAKVMKEWYNGYIFGKTPVYCPWDVINHISALRFDKTARPKNYWKNTSGNDILLGFVKRKDFNVKGKFETLMNGGAIVQSVSDQLTYDALHASEENLWSVLLMTGYLTKANTDEEFDDAVTLCIPNKEIATIFEDTVVQMFRDTVDNSVQRALMDALWTGDEKMCGELITKLLKKTVSYNDYHENYYHAFLAGVFSGIGYEVDSNREYGLGRPDIVLKDEDYDRVLVIETKRVRKKEDMDKACDEALEQIVKNEYGGCFDNFSDVICYGVAFFQKWAMAKRLV